MNPISRKAALRYVAAGIAGVALNVLPIATVQAAPIFVEGAQASLSETLIEKAHARRVCWWHRGRQICEWRPARRVCWWRHGRQICTWR